MPRKISVTVYSIDELDEKARRFAIRKHGEFLSEVFDCDQLTDDFKLQLAEAGFVNNLTCYWSLGHCQGDGVAFYGQVDVEALAAKQPAVAATLAKLKAIDGDISLCCEIHGKSNHSHHENSMRVTVDYELGASAPVHEDVATVDNVDKLAKELEGDVLSLCQEYSRKLQECGYADIDGCQEEEFVLDSIRANEYEFTKDGKIFHER